MLAQPEIREAAAITVSRQLARATALGLILALAACGSSTESTAPAPIAAPIAAQGATPEQEINRLADDYVAAVLDYDQTLSYFSGLSVKAHDRLPDHSERGLAAWAVREDEFSARLQAIDAQALAGKPARVTYAVLKENLESAREARVCHQERWAVNHMGGWQLSLTQIAELQPVDTQAHRDEALKRWQGLPRFVDDDIANLRHGLATGYAAPATVVKRVLSQVEGMIVADAKGSPFYVLAKNTEDAAFRTALDELISAQITPAIQRYRDFLATEYLPKARDTLGVSALPDGDACYRALLRAMTTLSRSPQEVFDLGKLTVAANEAGVIEIGDKVFGTRDVPAILRKVDEAKDNHFATEDELLAYSRDLVPHAKEKSASAFLQLPAQEAVVEPFPEYQRGSGVSSHYDPNPDATKSATYRIALEEWPRETRGSAEITAVHETWPGHHLQIAIAYGVPNAHDISKLSFNSAYIEGWARYAERLAEEQGIYKTDYARISRRIWPARGMVVDPGIHAFGWTRQQAVDYLVATGRFDAITAEATVDRIAVMPGQLTSYDSGGLEFMALRAQAEQALGARFDLREFHQRVLENGVVPLALLRESVEAWIKRSADTADKQQL